jgi:hypothetical protein
MPVWRRKNIKRSWKERERVVFIAGYQMNMTKNMMDERSAFLSWVIPRALVVAVVVVHIFMKI